MPVIVHPRGSSKGTALARSAPRTIAAFVPASAFSPLSSSLNVSMAGIGTPRSGNASRQWSSESWRSTLGFLACLRLATGLMYATCFSSFAPRRKETVAVHTPGQLPYKVDLRPLC